ncbi:MAG: hypothetical protein KGI37_09790 [Alphaproteobacteria bacterium]|nr:hypothetical protein [Alphaproteobacteria bacterium]
MAIPALAVITKERKYYLSRRANPQNWDDLMRLAASRPSPDSLPHYSWFIKVGAFVAQREEQRLGQSLWRTPLTAFGLAATYGAVTSRIIAARDAAPIRAFIDLCETAPPFYVSIPAVSSIMAAAQAFDFAPAMTEGELLQAVRPKPPAFIAHPWAGRFRPQGPSA